MSLQRILESARKLGVPVIMTDPAGREPLVIVPLEQFEAMAGSVENTPEEVRLGQIRNQPRPLPKTPGLPIKHGLTGLTASNVPLQADLESPEPTLEAIQAPNQSNPEISLDERFYLEPLEDGSAG